MQKKCESLKEIGSVKENAVNFSNSISVYSQTTEYARLVN